jgi:hypothetical protein
MMLIADGVLFNASFALAALIWEGIWAEPRAMLAAQAMLPVYFTLALYNRTYGVEALNDWLFGSRKALTALVIAAALLNFLASYTKSNEEFSSAAVTIGLVLTGCLLVTMRRLTMMVIAYRWSGRVTNRLIIEDNGPGFAHKDAERISAADYNLDPSSHDPFMLDRLGKLLRNQDHVVVSCPRERRADWAFLLKCAGVYGEIVSEPAHSFGAVGVHRYDELERTTLVVSTGPLGLRARILKRLFDMTIAVGGLIVLSPLLLIVALLIKLEDGGPVLFIQRLWAAATSSSRCSSSARCAKTRSITRVTVRPRAMMTGSPGSAPSSAAPALMSCRRYLTV